MTETSQAETESTEEMEAELRRRRAEDFRQRVERVLKVMREERIDWRGAPFITPDGRVGVRVAPVESDRS